MAQLVVKNNINRKVDKLIRGVGVQIRRETFAHIDFWGQYRTIREWFGTLWNNKPPSR